MAQNSRIEWTHHTFNPWWGCTKVSPGCDHCYAETWARRTGHNVWGHRASRRELSDNYWRQPLIWDREARQQNQRARVFCASMADVFEWRADVRHLRDRLWWLIDSTPSLDWLLLTKRPHLVARLVPWRNAEWPANVWLGTTVESQRWLERRMPYVAELSAKTRFLSCEPLLGPIDIAQWRGSIDWIIAGGESGCNARPSDPEWFRSLRDQCKTLGVPFHFKQWGEWAPATRNGSQGKARSQTYDIELIRWGKKRSGRKLDGQTWDEFPNASALIFP